MLDKSKLLALLNIRDRNKQQSASVPMLKPLATPKPKTMALIAMPHEPKNGEKLPNQVARPGTLTSTFGGFAKLKKAMGRF